MSDQYDQGEAVAFIIGERPRLSEEEIWKIVKEIGSPPHAGGEPLAVELIRQTHPEIKIRVAEQVIGEWRAYAELATQRDWDDDESDYINRFDD